MLFVRFLWLDLCFCDEFQGTQSLNPHNDYCQHFVDTGHRPQNFIRDVGECDLVCSVAFVVDVSTILAQQLLNDLVIFCFNITIL